MGKSNTFLSNWHNSHPSLFQVSWSNNVPTAGLLFKLRENAKKKAIEDELKSLGAYYESDSNGMGLWTYPFHDTFLRSGSAEDLLDLINKKTKEYHDPADNILNNLVFATLTGGVGMSNMAATSTPVVFAPQLYTGLTSGLQLLNTIGSTIGSMAIGQTADEVSKSFTGNTIGSNFRKNVASMGNFGQKLAESVPGIFWDFANPAYMISPTGVVLGLKYVTNSTPNRSSVLAKINTEGVEALTPEEYKIAEGIAGGKRPRIGALPIRSSSPTLYSPSNSTVLLVVTSLPVKEWSARASPEYITLNRPIYYHGNRIDTKAHFPRTDDNLELFDMLSKLNNLNYNISSLPTSHYVMDLTFTGNYERPFIGTEGLPLLSKMAKPNDVAYSLAHLIWNNTSKETKEILTPLYSKIFKRSGLESASTGFSLSKDVQATLNNNFILKNGRKVANYDEWVNYVDSLDSELLKKVIIRTHDGFYTNSLNLSDEGIEAFRETLKYKNGGRFKK